jgi:hypothetical protein
MFLSADHEIDAPRPHLVQLSDLSRRTAIEEAGRWIGNVMAPGVGP